MRKQAADGEKASGSERQAPHREREAQEGGSEEHRAEKPAERKYTIGNIATVRGGFYKELCDFTAKKGTVDAEMLCKEFAGRQINGRGINAARVDRYIRYALKAGQFKVAKSARRRLGISWRLRVFWKHSGHPGTTRSPTSFVISLAIGKMLTRTTGGRTSTAFSRRLLSRVHLSSVKFWIITEADRSATTFLLPATNTEDIRKLQAYGSPFGATSSK